MIELTSRVAGTGPENVFAPESKLTQVAFGSKLTDVITSVDVSRKDAN